MLAETAPQTFSRAGWLFELKYDGHRMLAEVDHQQVRLLTRRKTDATADHPHLVRALRALDARALLDCELVALGADGRPQFQLLQQGAPTTLFAFDLLGLDGADLRGLPLRDRKALLQQLLAGTTGPLRFTDHLETEGESLFRHVQSLQLEGMMAKDGQSPYRAGRSAEWLKVCVDRRVDLVVVGYSLGDSGGMASLHLAGFLDGALTYAGKVGAAMPETLRATVQAALQSRRTDLPACAFPKGARRPTGSTEVWCAPELSCEVRVKEITEAGALRQPLFLRLRADKPLEDCLHPLQKR